MLGKKPKPRLELGPKPEVGVELAVEPLRVLCAGSISIWPVVEVLLRVLPSPPPGAFAIAAVDGKPFAGRCPS